MREFNCWKATFSSVSKRTSSEWFTNEENEPGNAALMDEEIVEAVVNKPEHEEIDKLAVPSHGEPFVYVHPASVQLLHWLLRSRTRRATNTDVRILVQFV